LIVSGVPPEMCDPSALFKTKDNAFYTVFNSFSKEYNVGWALLGHHDIVYFILEKIEEFKYKGITVDPEVDFLYSRLVCAEEHSRRLLESLDKYSD
jgi:hypothetical protein